MDAFVVLWERDALGEDFSESVFPSSDPFDFDHFGVGDEIDPASGGVDFHASAEFGLHPALDVKFGALPSLELDFVSALAPLRDFGNPMDEGGAIDREVFADLVNFGRFVEPALEFEVEEDSVARRAEVAVLQDVEDRCGVCGDGNRAFGMMFGKETIE